ncbi:hypothetical protein [Algoriella sp.]|uniref:hypothetical protein n=1 Tax=Algoriella sp. TaxID=1872434 RepID=UPI002FC8A514
MFVEDDGKIDDLDVIYFKQLIAHEYIEAKLMEKGVNFRSFINPDSIYAFDIGAHFLSTNLRKGFKIDPFGQLEMPPKINEENLDNLDEIVEYYINLLKL